MMTGDKTAARSSPKTAFSRNGERGRDNGSQVLDREKVKAGFSLPSSDAEGGIKTPLYGHDSKAYHTRSCPNHLSDSSPSVLSSEGGLRSPKSCGVCCGCYSSEQPMKKSSLETGGEHPSAALVYREHAAHYTHKFRADIDYTSRERPRQVLWGTVLIVLLFLIGFYDELFSSSFFQSPTGVRTPQSSGAGKMTREDSHRIDNQDQNGVLKSGRSEEEGGEFTKGEQEKDTPNKEARAKEILRGKETVGTKKGEFSASVEEGEGEEGGEKSSSGQTPSEKMSEDEEYCKRFSQDSKCSPTLLSSSPSSPSSFLDDPRSPSIGSQHASSSETAVQTGVAPSLFSALFMSSSSSSSSPPSHSEMFYRHSTSMKRVVLALLVLVCLYCFLQSKDGLLVRPHPGFWRVVHGVCLVHLLVMVVLLVVNEETGGLLLEYLFPEISGKRHSVFSGTLVMDCRINFETLQRQIRSVWFISHVVGWLCKMMILRHWGFCLLYSLAFELGELSFHWLVPELCECWWDSIFIDAILSNVSGMLLGAAIMKLSCIYQYDWLGCHPLCKKVCITFTPFTSENYDWSFFKTPRHLFLAILLLLMCLFLELNVFFLMAVLGIPATHYINPLRTVYLSLLGASAAAEHYEYTMYSRERIGHNEWLLAIILCIEVLVCMKYGKSKFPRFIPPLEIFLPWVIALSLLSIWCYCYFTTISLRSGIKNEETRKGEEAEEKKNAQNQGHHLSHEDKHTEEKYDNAGSKKRGVQRLHGDSPGKREEEDHLNSVLHGEDKVRRMKLDDKERTSSRPHDWTDRFKLLILTMPPQACFLPLLYLMKFYFYDFVQLEREL
ncbi:phosphatidylserine synthase [Cystoisospora suis]|uniref:Phosphatidylserine synthase n=1 Tax=Cystoisospora suis TaxID=483139 RepID=A0A2C6KKC2_9APIC|nr:phosphatidylserine synthase [Cystoisospora suis]